MIFHLVKPQYWKTFDEKDTYFAETFEQEGFIHCSTTEQIAGVLERYYKNAGEMLLLHIDDSKLSSKLIYEKATNDELFPHIFGGINKSAIKNIEILVEQSVGVYTKL